MTVLPNSSFFQEAEREKLSQALRDPLLATAFDLVIREAQPRADILAKLSPDQQAAISNQLAGMSDFIRRLQILASPATPLADGLPSESGQFEYLEESEE